MNYHRLIVTLLVTIVTLTASAAGIKEELDIHRILRTGQNNAKCSANTACAGLKLAGDCCPTKKGVTLDCCKVKSKKCNANASCNKLGLKGDCCPTKDGVLLDCCKAA